MYSLCNRRSQVVIHFSSFGRVTWMRVMFGQVLIAWNSVNMTRRMIVYLSNYESI